MDSGVELRFGASGPYYCYCLAIPDSLKRQDDVDCGVHQKEPGYDYDHGACDDDR